MNLDLDSFTYITGIAGLLGLMLQLKDSFPLHREIRKTTVLLVLGVFLGSLITSLKGVRVDLNASIRPFEILVAIFVAVLGIVAIAGAFTKESNRRTELFAFSGIGTLALFMLLLFGGIGSLEEDRAGRARRQVNVEELLELSTLHASRASYERAILFLEEAKSRLPRTDERQKILDERIKGLKGKQVDAK
jgi:hypothetical protein